MAKPDLSKPIARPARPLERTSSHLSVALRPLGSVPFDGLTLPLTSPNGRYIAAQHGPTPSWDAVLCAPTPDGSKVPVQLAIAGFEVLPPSRGPASPDRPSLARLPWSRPAESPLLIGRSCDDDGFLVESPRPESGSRWIGRVGWTTGAVQWLVRPDADTQPMVACFGAFGPRAQLAFCRAAHPGEAFDLVVRPSPATNQGEIVLHPEPGCTYACPFFSGEPDRLYAFRVSAAPDARLALVAIDLPVPRTGEAKPEPARIVASIDLNCPASIATAYQSALVLQTPWPLDSGDRSPAGLPVGVPFAAPDTASMQWFDPDASAATPLARGTLGAVPALMSSGSSEEFRGLFLGAAKELVFQSAAPVGAAGFGADAPVVQGAFLPRLTSARRDGSRVYLLLTPPLPTQPPEVGISQLVPVP